jgi:anti-sigma factor ChrR (cupin superfamily)
MRNDLPHDAIKERAALYALGALSQHEARSFEEHLAEGCEDCRAELEGFELVVSNLGFGAEDESPSALLRERLLSRLAAEDVAARPEAAAPGAAALPVASVRAYEGEWQEVIAGVLMKPLYVDEATGMATSLVKMGAGGRLPVHRHSGVEQLFVLEGDCRIQGEVLGPGDFHRAEAGSVHEATYTEGGTTFLLIAPLSYEFLDAE